MSGKQKMQSDAAAMYTGRHNIKKKSDDKPWVRLSVEYIDKYNDFYLLK